MSKLDRIAKPITDKLLTVMPHHPDEYSDIRLALKAWRKYCTFDYEFIVIGDCLESLIEEFDWITFIKCEKIRDISGQYNPHLDVQHKFEAVSNLYSNKYDGFIRMMDDNYAVKPFYLSDIITVHYHQPSFAGIKSKPTSYWKHDMWKTRQLLDKENLPHINYATHFPFYFEFSKLKELWDKYDMRNNSYCYENLYFNYYSHEEPVIDSDIRYAVCSRKDSSGTKIQDAINNTSIKFLFSSNDGWNESFHRQMEGLIM